MTYSLEFREKVVSARAQHNLSIAETAKKFHVGESSVEKWSKNIIPKKTKNRPFIKLDVDALKKDIEAFPNAYNYERAKRLGVSKNCILYALRKLNAMYISSISDSSLEKNFVLFHIPRKFCY